MVEEIYTRTSVRDFLEKDVLDSFDIFMEYGKHI